MAYQELRFSFSGLGPEWAPAVYEVHGTGDAFQLILKSSLSPCPGSLKVEYTTDLVAPSFALEETPNIKLTSSFWRLHEYDLVFIDFEKGLFEIAWRSQSSSNSVLITEQCNHRCLMCSQPPKLTDDFDWRVKLDLLAEVLPENSDVLCLTGGEPSLYLDKLAAPVGRLIHKDIRGISILSNGALLRRSNVRTFAEAVDPHKILWCIPLYSHFPSVHDQIVASNGAWYKTLEGMQNLHEEGFAIQLRFIPLKQNQLGIAEYLEFVNSSLSFVHQLVIMGLEVTGYAVGNLSDIAPDFVHVAQELHKAEVLLRRLPMEVNLLNLPLCLLPPTLHRYSVNSISDWKNFYPKECDACDLKQSCAGFFSTPEADLFTPKPFLGLTS
jgi:His-Xaa-Ser system radical SAM maturase HxsC